MPRAPRLLAPETTYHLMARGNNGMPIYADDHDRARFLRLLATAIARHGWDHFAYCLMGNHFHLLVRIKKPDLPAGMGQLLSEYARTFNRRHGRSGHLFRERYKAVVVKDDRHFFTELRYVAMNPVRAGLVRRPEEWIWSSYPSLLAGTGAAVPVAVDEILDLFHSNPPRARALLRAFVEESCGRPATGDHRASDRRPSIATLVQLMPMGQAIASARKLGYSQREIAEHLGLSRWTVMRWERSAPGAR